MDDKTEAFYLSLLSSPDETPEETRACILRRMEEILAYPDSQEAALLRGVQADQTTAPTVEDFFRYLMIYFREFLDLTRGKAPARPPEGPSPRKGPED